ncbi:zinc finger SWIM domain-containing protein 7-like [Halichondria panicea]|uniref:zinc finger SWIM domain-containing protein 7-like n=1 Tax=Halichondria panicea TaxID=6063 RepID=UPI00312B8296
MESLRRILQGTIDQLLLEVRRESQNNLEGPSLPENLLSALHSVFQQSLLHALDLVDKNHVMCFVCPAGRELFQVQASAGNRVYTCLVSSNYCNCPSFVYSVVLKEDALMCKHLLAVQLGRALDRVETKDISGEEFAKLLSADTETLLA